MGVNNQVGLIGVGLVGSALAERLAGAGVAVTAYDVNPAFGQAIHGLPVRVAASARDVAKATAIVLLAAARLGCVLPLSEAHAALLDAAIAAGDGDLDSAAIVEELRRRRVAPAKDS